MGDIYGGDYGGIGLSSNMIASSFGKLKDVEDPEELSNLKKHVINAFYYVFLGCGTCLAYHDRS